jgi:hypothetical protein
MHVNTHLFWSAEQNRAYRLFCFYNLLNASILLDPYSRTWKYLCVCGDARVHVYWNFHRLSMNYAFLLLFGLLVMISFHNFIIFSSSHRLGSMRINVYITNESRLKLISLRLCLCLHTKNFSKQKLCENRPIQIRQLLYNIPSHLHERQHFFENYSYAQSKTTNWQNNYHWTRRIIKNKH